MKDRLLTLIPKKKGEMMLFKRRITEVKKNSVDINRAGEIAEKLQVFFRDNKIEPIDAMASMMILTEFIKRQLNILPEDYNKIVEMLGKVK